MLKRRLVAAIWVLLACLLLIAGRSQIFATWNQSPWMIVSSAVLIWLLYLLNRIIIVVEPREPKSPQDISINGNVQGTGIAIGTGARASVTVVASDPQQQQLAIARTQVRKTVFAIWISDFLNPELERVPSMAVITQRIDVQLDTPSQRRAQHPSQPWGGDPLSLTHAFASYGSQVLVLGEPGAGKTIALLQLTKALLAADHEQVPVVLLLADWNPSAGSFRSWIIAKLVRDYTLTETQSALLLDRAAFTLVLDGLDQVANPSACIAAINAFRANHGAIGIVVSCRTAIYLASPPLALHVALAVQPLADATVVRALQDVGLADLYGASVATTSHVSHPVSVEFWRLPLIVSLLIRMHLENPITGGGKLGVTELPTSQDVVRAYIDSALRKRQSSLFSPEAMDRAIGWLAAYLARSSERVFYLERMQPRWALAPEQWQRFDSYVALFRALWLAIAAGAFISGTVIVLLVLVAPSWWEQIQWIGAPLLYGGTISGLLLLFGGFALRAARRSTTVETIELVETVIWSPQDLRRAFVRGLLVTVVVAVAAVWLYGLLGVLSAAAAGIFAMLLRLDSVSTIAAIADDVRKVSKGGISRSARIALLASISSAVASSIYLVSILLPLAGSTNTMIITFGMALGIGLFASTKYGAETYVKHYILQFMLIRSGRLPFALPHVLVEGDRLVLLRSIGAGYLFIHDLVQDEFLARHERRAQ